jgi:antitoxin component YwqK of YwqJK toxin-antitoxin module
MKKAALKEHTEYHKDGTIWAKGQMADEVPVGYWEWFRKDGTKLRSGHFQEGEQVGEWTTYDTKGEIYKVTTIKTKLGQKATPKVKRKNK